MKMDPIILGMVRSDVEIVLAVAIRDHLACECVDRRDPDVLADHLAEKVAEMLETPPDVDGSYGKFAKQIIDQDTRRQ